MGSRLNDHLVQGRRVNHAWWGRNEMVISFRSALTSEVVVVRFGGSGFFYNTLTGVSTHILAQPGVGLNPSQGSRVMKKE
jgi:hypothetical protein